MAASSSIDPFVLAYSSMYSNSSNSTDSTSILTDKFDCGSLKRKSKHPNSYPQFKDKKAGKAKKQKKMKDGEEKGYIHVRARRGQATDSHSLAERVRRERISERMKLLQSIVPGCDKVTGKALMLDEIINYVQSLQNQVEFLSMKLASANPMFYDFGMDLESLMVRPDQELSNLASQLPSMQECSSTTANNYQYLLQNSPNSTLFHQAQLVQPQQPQESRQSLWEVDEHRQSIINQSGFSSNTHLFSFH